VKLLRANTQRNGFARVDLHEVALSDSAGVAEFTIFEDGWGLASFAPESEAGQSVQVAVTTLDSLTESFGERVALVKLDVEGAEAGALRGAADLISRAAPLFLFEVEPGHLAGQGSSVDDVIVVMAARPPSGRWKSALVGVLTQDPEHFPIKILNISLSGVLHSRGSADQAQRALVSTDAMRPNLVLAPSS